MCAILGIFNIKENFKSLREKALELSKLQRHRGPDWSGIYVGKSAIVTHERLSIVGVDSGAQPLFNADHTNVLAVNGEIYNHKELEKELAASGSDYTFATKSDCEVILALYEQQGMSFIDSLKGMFAFALYDEKNDSFLIARDHIGIIPLYTGHDEVGNFYVASEMKALIPVCTSIEEFPPGCYLSSTEGEIKKYYTRDWQSYSAVKDTVSSVDTLREAFEKSVKTHLMSDVPYGVLLSGGLDSSVVAAVAKKFVKKRIEDDERSDAWWPQLHSFAIGLEGSPDLAAAQKVADFIGTVHHSFTYTVQEGIDALSDVIQHIETYDVTTIRASTPMYLMARMIKSMGIKMVLSGEGADEIFGGYLYFHMAPNPQEFHEETIRKLDRLHWYDCLRANKSMAAWGVEARVPFLDKEFMDTAMSLNPKDKMAGGGKIEKNILREAFKGYLPDEILWRQKEQFSDGVGYSWIDSLKEIAEKEISDHMFENAHHRFPVNTPDSKEAFFYRTIFEKHFPHSSAIDCVPGGKSIACSTAEAFAWMKEAGVNDPSGRAVKNVHKAGYK